MTTTELARRIIDALAVDGFEPQIGPGTLTLRGHLGVRDRKVPTRIVYRDLEFCDAPTFVIEDLSSLRRPVFPHVDEAGELCVVDKHRFVTDRYAAPENARGFIIRARELLENGLTRHAVEEIAREFPQHWGGSIFGYEFDRYEGAAEIYEDSRGFMRVRRSDAAIPRRLPTIVLRTQARLSFEADQQRPSTLAEVLEWAGRWDARLRDQMLSGLATLSAQDPCVFINAVNGTVGFQVQVSKRGSKQVDALRRPGAWNALVQSQFVMRLSVKRLQGRQAGMQYVLGRSANGVVPLAGKKVALVGCGSIGGYLSYALAQLGAGFDVGALTLIDPEDLAETNVARHILGWDSVGKPKAHQCKALIERAVPGLHIFSRKAHAQAQRELFAAADLVIDATGETAVSEMLNAWSLELRPSSTRSPSLMHVWIEGQGAAARCFVSSDPEYGCFRCLHPDHLEKPRFGALQDSAPRELIGGCGETPFTPYGPAAPMAASALAIQHVSEWASGNQRPLLRTVRLNWADTVQSKPTSPSKSAHCPACYGR